MDYLLFGGFALVLAGIFIGSSQLKDRRAFSSMLFGSGLFFMGITGMFSRDVYPFDVLAFQIFNIFFCGTVFGLGLARFVPPPEDIRAFFRRKVLGS
jgi:hypothetical protein